MGIRFHCPYCQKKLNVKAFLAGKRGICPYCDSGLDIPLESERRNGKGKLPTESVEVQTVPREGEAAFAGPAAEASAQAGITDSPTAEASPSESGGKSSIKPSRISSETTAETSRPPSPPESNGPDAIDENPEAVWYVRPPSGGQFGPAKGDVMRKWLDEGRVSPDSLVWREGWADWQEAEPTFPSLSKRSSPPSPPAPASAAGPSAAQSTSSQAVAVAKPAARMVADSGPAEPQPKPDTAATKALARRRSNLPALIAVGVLVVVSMGLLVGLIVALNMQR
jgi:hypothetical protein